MPALPARTPHPAAQHAPALAQHYNIPAAARGASRWHVTFCTTHKRHVTARTTPEGAPCCHVTPTLPGFDYAARLADALNRAYGIDPLEGFDVAPVLGTLEAQATARNAARY